METAHRRLVAVVGALVVDWPNGQLLFDQQKVRKVDWLLGRWPGLWPRRTVTTGLFFAHFRRCAARGGNVEKYRPQHKSFPFPPVRLGRHKNPARLER